jgi:hypothetical protein
MNEKTRDDIDAAKIATQNMTYPRTVVKTFSPHEEYVHETNAAIRNWLIKNKNWK